MKGGCLFSIELICALFEYDCSFSKHSVLMWQLGPEEISVIFLEAAAFETFSGPCSVQEREKSQHTLAT